MCLAADQRSHQPEERSPPASKLHYTVDERGPPIVRGVRAIAQVAAIAR
jgi:hypothetical protein